MTYHYKNIEFHYAYVDDHSIYVYRMYIKDNNSSIIEFPSYIENMPVKDINWKIFSGYSLSNIKYIKFPEHSRILPNGFDYNICDNIRFIKYAGFIIKIKNNNYSIL